MQLLHRWVEEKSKQVLSTMSRRFEERHTLRKLWARLPSFVNLVSSYLPCPAIEPLVGKEREREREREREGGREGGREGERRGSSVDRWDGYFKNTC